MRISHFLTTLQNVRKAPDHPKCIILVVYLRKDGEKKSNNKGHKAFVKAINKAATKVVDLPIKSVL